MSDCLEQQAEEVEVLQSIYEGDEHFKQLSPTRFQYMYGEEETKSILLEISWPETYPSSLPNINLDLFHNGNIPDELKNEIKGKLSEQATDLLDCAMTYSLFDWMKESSEIFIERIPLSIAQKETNSRSDAMQPEKAKKERKEQLTKSQKRRITQQTNYKGERERGWNWVDVVKHLSQTGKSVSYGS